MKKILGSFWILLILTFMPVFAGKPGPAEAADDSEKLPGRLTRITPASRAEDPFSDISFPTIYKSGHDVCTNAEGQPVILLFSSSSCSHCEWAGEIFDPIVKFYIADGLIEAHHYDTQTGDDLLTDEVETQIPPAYLQLKKDGDPKGLVPYYNFSCKYERIGNGHEKTDDIAAEGEEICMVIETLIQVLSR